MEPIKEETRVRFAAKQNAKGQVQLDLTTEAQTVEKAARLMDGAIDKLRSIVESKGLEIAK